MYITIVQSFLPCMISQSETEDQNIFVCTSWVLSRLKIIPYRIDQHPIVEAAFENGSHHFFRNDKFESGQVAISLSNQSSGTTGSTFIY